MPKLTNRAYEDLNNLPPPLADKARAIIGRLDENPTLGKKFKGPLKGMRSARLGRTHRIIYSIAPGAVIVRTIRPRKDAYR